MKDMQKMIKKNNFSIEYPANNKILKKDDDISFIKYLKFDIESKFLVCYGDHKIFIMDLDPKARDAQYRMLSIDANIYGKILTLQFKSHD